ncbi:MAG: translocation and assembly module TamB [Lentisphaeria bacterium]|jgi:translocation and assembly module TamB
MSSGESPTSGGNLKKQTSNKNKNRWVKLFARIVIYSLLVLGLIFTGTSLWVLNSESGLRWVWRQVEPQLPSSLAIETLTGSVAGSIFSKRLLYSDESQKVELRDIALDCDWLVFAMASLSLLGLEHATLYCRRLDVGGLEIIVYDDQGEVATLSDQGLGLDVKLPFKLSVKQLNIGELSVRPGEANIDFKTIHAKKITWIKNKIGWRALSAQYDVFNLTSKGELSLKGKLKIDATATIDSGTPSSPNYLSASLSFNGDLGQSSIVASLLSPERVTLSAQASILPDLNADLSVKWATLDLYPYIGEHISLTNGRSDVVLQWPGLSIAGSSKLNTEFSNDVDLAFEVSTDSILNVDYYRGELNADARFTLKGESTYLAELKQSDIPLAFSGEINAKVINSVASISTKHFKVDNIDVSVDAHGDHRQAEANIRAAIAPPALTLSKSSLTSHLEPSKPNILKNGQPLVSVFSTQWQGVDISGLAASAKLSWSDNKFNGSGKVKALALQMKKNFAKNVNINFSSLLPLSASLHADSVEIETGAKIKDVDVDLAGTLSSHTIKFGASVLGNEKLVLKTVGHNIGDTWRFDALDFQWRREQGHAYTLSGKELSLSQQGIEVKSACLKLVEESACLNASLSSNKHLLALRFMHFPLGFVEEISSLIGIKNIPKISGDVSGDFEVSALAKEWNIISIASTTSSLHIPQLELQHNPFGGLIVRDLFLVSEEQKPRSLMLSWSLWNLINDKPELRYSSDEGEAHIQFLGNRQFEGGIGFGPGRLRHKVKTDTDDDLLSSSTNELSPDADISEQDSAKYQDLEFLLDSLDLSFSYRQDALSSSLSARLPQSQFIDLKLSASNSRFDKTTELSGVARAHMSSFSWLGLFYPVVDRIYGVVDGDLAIDGHATKPLINGDVKIAISELLMDEYAIKALPSNIHIISQGQSARLHGDINLPRGNVALNGLADWSDGIADSHAVLELKGENLKLVSGKSAEITLDPNLKLEVDRHDISLRGEVDVISAKIKMAEIPRSAVGVSDDQIIVDRSSSRTSGPGLDVDVTINVRDRVAFEGFGVTTRLAGSVRTMYDQNERIVASGSVKLVKGKVKLYGQELEITEGEFLFLGSPSNPGVQLKAVRDLDTVVVGVRIDGTVLRPRTSFFSQPTMEDSDILAYLITGKPVSRLSKSEGSAVANAAISLGTAGANRVAQQLAGIFGLKNIEIKSRTTAERTRLDISSQISDDVSVGYGTNLDNNADAQASWLLEYKISQKIYLEVNSGKTQSADITYRIEFE